MIILDRKLVDEVIRLAKRYYVAHDRNYLPALSEAEDILAKSSSWPVVRLLGDLAQYTVLSGKGTYRNIYRALEAFGIIVEDKELEKIIRKENNNDL